MNFKQYVIALAGIFVAAVASAMPAGPALFGIDFQRTGQSNLIRINTATGAATTIGAMGMGTYAGLGTYNNALYGLLMLGNGGILQKIDPGTGNPISSVAIAANFVEGGLDIDSRGNVFSIDNSFRLMTFPVTGGAATILGGPMARQDNGELIRIDGLAFGAGDVLYGYSQDSTNPQLYQVNQSDGTLTPKGAFINSNNLGGLAARSDDLLFGVTSPFASGAPKDLYSINPANGSTRHIGNLGAGHSDVTGLSFLGEINAVPEPATWILFGTGCLMMGLVRRNNKNDRRGEQRRRELAEKRFPSSPSDPVQPESRPEFLIAQAS